MVGMPMKDGSSNRHLNEGSRYIIAGNGVEVDMIVANDRSHRSGGRGGTKTGERYKVTESFRLARTAVETKTTIPLPTAFLRKPTDSRGSDNKAQT